MWGGQSRSARRIMITAMSAKVLLKDIVDALEMQFDEQPSFLDLDSGQVEVVSRDLLSQVEDADENEEPELPEWQKGEWEICKKIVTTDRFVRLPDQFEVHEWGIMEEFIEAVESERFGTICRTRFTDPEPSGTSGVRSNGTTSSRTGIGFERKRSARSRSTGAKKMGSNMLSRRGLFGTLLAGSLRAGTVPIRAITRGPRFHWFAYYDKLQFDPAGRYALAHEVDFEHRSPRPDDVIRVGMVDLEDGDRWIELGDSRAWNWQQGSMLQWLPGSRTDVIWNDRVGGQFVSHVLNVKTGRKRTLPGPVYSISPDAKWAVYPDFRRLNRTRPGYGYAGVPDPYEQRTAPDQAGIWRIDLETGKQRLLISLDQASRVPNRHSPWEPPATHWFNHLLHSPDGSRFIFLHRWRGPKQGKGFGTRMFTSSADGTDLFVLDPYGGTSHFIWRDPRHVLAWAIHPSHGERFYLYEDRTENVEVIGEQVMTVNGHCTYLPGNRWILNDTYPDAQRLQHLYLYQVATGRRVPLGDFHSDPVYTGEWRCDLHPRFSPDGTRVTIDSTHGGNGRQLYLVDIASLVRG